MPRLAFRHINGNEPTPSPKNTRIDTAKLITKSEYNKLPSPIFEGQTGVNSKGEYRMYCSQDGLFYYTNNVL